MLKKFTFSALLGLCLLALTHDSGIAQDISHKQADDFADWLVADGQHAKAAGLYADAHDEKARSVYAYKAAELYFFVKDYAKAAKYFKQVTSSDFPLAKFMYASSLKRMAQYEEAQTVFEDFIAGYTLADSAAVRSNTEAELKGIEFAIAEMERVDPTIFVDDLSPIINGMKNEIAPMTTPEGNIAFLSDLDGVMRVYTSSRVGTDWSQMRPAEEFPELEDEHISGGSLVTPERFIFSVCENKEHMAQPTAVCVIKEARLIGGDWNDAKPLADNINVPGSSATQPYVFVEDGKEVMIFASNRPNGMGGFDLWKAERTAGSSTAKFGTPVNLGEKVNGPGNEVTPFFDTETRVLSFSTDFGTTLGGYDVMHATATKGVDGWKEAVNPGTPVNSAGDDYYYRTVAGTSTAYLASTRAKRMERTKSVNSNLYTVSYDSKNIEVEVMVVDERTGQAVSDPTLTVSLNPDGFQLKPMTIRRSLDGYYMISLPVEREISLDVERPYFDDLSETITIPANEKDGFQVRPIRIRRTPVGKDDIMVVARSVKPGTESPAGKAEVMTASGEDEN